MAIDLSSAATSKIGELILGKDTFSKLLMDKPSPFELKISQSLFNGIKNNGSLIFIGMDFFSIHFD